MSLLAGQSLPEQSFTHKLKNIPRLHGRFPAARRGDKDEVYRPVFRTKPKATKIAAQSVHTAQAPASISSDIQHEITTFRMPDVRSTP